MECKYVLPLKNTPNIIGRGPTLFTLMPHLLFKATAILKSLVTLSCIQFWLWSGMMKINVHGERN